jgi:hypothetical protein
MQFVQHFCRIAWAIEQNGLWDEEDGFFYDLLRLPDGTATPSRPARSSGPADCATLVIERDLLTAFPGWASASPGF